MATITADEYLDSSMCVYLVENTVNGKRYVGQTIRTLRQRWSSHQSSGNGALRNAINKYGADSFRLSVLELCSNQDELDRVERKWIANLETISPNGYNLTSGGQSAFVVSDLTRETMKASHRGGHKRSAESLEKFKKSLAETIKRRNEMRVASGISLDANERSRRKRGIEARGVKQRGVAKTEEHKSNHAKVMMRGRVIECSNGKIYETMREAVADTLVDRVRISRVAKGERKTAGGFTFRYLDLGGASSLR